MSLINRTLYGRKNLTSLMNEYTPQVVSIYLRKSIEPFQASKTGIINKRIECPGLHTVKNFP